MKFDRRLLLTSFTILFLISLVWDFVLYFLPSKTTPWNYLYGTLYTLMDLIGAIVLIMYGLNYGLKSNLGKMLSFFGLGLLLFAIGNGVFLYYYVFLNAAMPYPSWADAVFVVGNFFMFFGPFFLVKIYQPLITKKIVTVSLIIALISFITIFTFFAKPDLSAEIPFVQKFLNVFYPASDVINLILAVIALQIGGGKLHYYFYIIGLRFIATAVGDLIYTYKATAGTYWVGDIPDLMYSIGGYLLIVGLIEIIFNLKQPAVEVDKQNEIS